MSYNSFHSEHSIGDTVYFYESSQDKAVRGQVTKIEAVCTEPGYVPKWQVQYTIKPKWAADAPTHDYVVDADKVKDNMRDVFPPIPAEAEALA